MSVDINQAVEVLSNTWTDTEGTTWTFNPTVGDFLRIKRAQGVDFLDGKFPESIYKFIDAAEIILADQIAANGLELFDVADRIVEDPEGFQAAFLGGIQSFFLQSHQTAKAGLLMAARIDPQNQSIFGGTSSESQERQG